MKQIKSLFSIESMSAVMAWLFVSVYSLTLMYNADGFSITQILTAAFLLLVFIIGFLIAIQEDAQLQNERLRPLLLIGQLLAIIGAMFLIPYGFIAILLTIWSCQIPYYMQIRNAIILSPVWISLFWAIQHFYWQQEYAFINATLFWTFNLFALVMVNSTLKEQRAREAANELNRELMATQALLSEASKQAERVRIARNIHDLLGHHLTALTINLQVASRITDGQAQEKIQQCHELAKLLLSDVREAVSEIREKSNLQLVKALEALIEDVPEIQVKLDCEDDLHISDVTVAETILRCVQEGITNTLKHSNASTFHIHLAQRKNGVYLQMQDNGKLKSGYREGNGLTGMKERIIALGGQLNIQQSLEGFNMTIDLPEAR